MAGSQGSGVPRRIQRKRTKGWRMPANTEYVGRPTKYANKFIVGRLFVFERMAAGGGQRAVFVVDAAHAVRLYRRFLLHSVWLDTNAYLRGKNLACWCPLDQPCHADHLIAMANGIREPLIPDLCLMIFDLPRAP